MRQNSGAGKHPELRLGRNERANPRVAAVCRHVNRAASIALRTRRLPPTMCVASNMSTHRAAHEGVLLRAQAAVAQGAQGVDQERAVLRVNVVHPLWRGWGDGQGSDMMRSASLGMNTLLRTSPFHPGGAPTNLQALDQVARFEKDVAAGAVQIASSPTSERRGALQLVSRARLRACK